jgi:hypothetical protein
MALRFHLHGVAALAATAAALLVGTPSHAADYRFSQGGFDGGATINGSFAGEDGDGDGWLFQYELSNFSLSFSGNTLVNAFTHSYANGSGPGNFAYRIGSPTFDAQPYGGLWTLGEDGDNDGPNTVRYASYEWEAEGVPGLVIDFDRGTQSATDELLNVTAAPVPEPETWLLMGAGLAAMGVVSRRRRRGTTVTPTRVPGAGAALERMLRRAGWAARDAFAAWVAPRVDDLDDIARRDLGLSHNAAVAGADPIQRR